MSSRLVLPALATAPPYTAAQHAELASAQASLPWRELASAPIPVYRQFVTWLLFWPMLTLIARQAVYFAGPARTEAFYKGLAGPGADYHLQLYIILLFQTAIALAGNRQLWHVLRVNPLILAGMGLAFASALWSGSPQITVQTSIGLALSTLFACYLTTALTTEGLMGLLMFMGAVSAALSILFVIALPSYGIFAGYAGGAWQGICNHKNTLGLSMAYLLTPVFFATQYRKLPRIFYALLILFMILMSQSKGAWLYTAGMLCFVGCLFLFKNLRRAEAPFLLCLLLIAIAACATGAWLHIDSAARALGKDPSLSGRTVIYREVWQSILRQPLLGYGYGAFWGVDREATRIGIAISWFTGYSESGILELALYLGLVGVALVLLMLSRAVLQGVRLLRSPFYSNRVGWFLTLLFLAALTNLDAGWLLVSSTLDWVLILVACIGLEAESRRLRHAQNVAAVAPLGVEEVIA